MTPVLTGAEILPVPSRGTRVRSVWGVENDLQILCPLIPQPPSRPEEITNLSTGKYTLLEAEVPSGILPSEENFIFGVIFAQGPVGEDTLTLSQSGSESFLCYVNSGVGIAHAQGPKGFQLNWDAPLAVIVEPNDFAFGTIHAHDMASSGDIADWRLRATVEEYVDKFLSGKPDLIHALWDSIEWLRQKEWNTFVTFNADGVLTIKALPDKDTRLFVEVDSQGDVDAATIASHGEIEELKLTKVTGLTMFLDSVYGT